MRGIWPGGALNWTHGGHQEQSTGQIHRKGAEPRPGRFSGMIASMQPESSCLALARLEKTRRKRLKFASDCGIQMSNLFQANIQMGTRAPFLKRAIGGFSPDFNPQPTGTKVNRQLVQVEIRLSHSKQRPDSKANRQLFLLFLFAFLTPSPHLPLSKLLRLPTAVLIEWSVLNTVCEKLP
jgi:hypothetical protein